MPNDLNWMRAVRAKHHIRLAELALLERALFAKADVLRLGTGWDDTRGVRTERLAIIKELKSCTELEQACANEY